MKRQQKTRRSGLGWAGAGLLGRAADIRGADHLGGVGFLILVDEAIMVENGQLGVGDAELLDCLMRGERPLLLDLGPQFYVQALMGSPLGEDRGFWLMPVPITCRAGCNDDRSDDGGFNFLLRLFP